MLRNILNNKMDKLNINQSILAKSIKLDKGTISRFFSGEKETSFESVIKIVRELEPSRETELMEYYMLEVAKKENVINAFEYASIHRMFDTTKKLIALWQSSDNAEIREWILLYELSLKFQSQPTSSVYDDVKAVRVKTEIAEIFRYLLMAHDSFRTKHFQRVMEFAMHVESIINEMKDSFVKRSYLVRVCELYAHTYMRVHNDVETTRKYANCVLELADSVIYRANAHITIGLSYMFDDYEKALRYFYSARELQLSVGRSTYNSDSSIYFVRNLWAINEIMPNEDFKDELAHYHIVIGNIEEGIKILDSMRDDAFTLYYRWKATGDVSHLYKSAKLLKINEDKYYLNRLIRPSLVKAGVSIEVADLICQ